VEKRLQVSGFRLFNFYILRDLCVLCGENFLKGAGGGER
jgi:hypothetical protein